ncbi:MAG TPA: hypothetical protein VN814_12780 [Caulobacteraceae bacterium]|nr:hypothetical protein [Caulobacteraceae bacterium]
MVLDRRVARWTLAASTALLIALSLGPAASAARRCGGPNHLACGPAAYCHVGGLACRSRDGVGVCQARPRICPDIWIGVCGCDGRTYANTCQAERAGASVAHPGKCGAPKP